MFPLNKIFNIFLSNIKADTGTNAVSQQKNSAMISDEELNKVRTGSSTIKVTVSPSEEHYDNIQPQDTELYSFLRDKGLVPVKILTIFSNPLQTLQHADNTPASLNLLTTMLMKDRMNTNTNDQFNFHKGSMVHIWKSILNEDPCDPTELQPDSHEVKLQELEEAKQKILDDQAKKEQELADKKAAGEPTSTVHRGYAAAAKKKEQDAIAAQKKADEAALAAERAQKKADNLEAAAKKKASKSSPKHVEEEHPVEEEAFEEPMTDDETQQQPSSGGGGATGGSEQQPPVDEVQLTPEEEAELQKKLAEQQQPPADGSQPSANTSSPDGTQPATTNPPPAGTQPQAPPAGSSTLRKSHLLKKNLLKTSQLFPNGT
ncbi:hypothetical protein CDIK_1739 [Cucumispora dikerogammari]|nr:hypothetical protein CDIK_1739 [Cucumispora dikerogammari]